MPKTKRVDTHNGGWVHGVGRKGTGAPGKKRRQGSRRLGQFKDLSAEEGKQFEQKVPAGQKRLMSLMRKMQGGGRLRGGLDDGPKPKQKQKPRKQDGGAAAEEPDAAAAAAAEPVDAGTARWLSTADGGTGGLDAGEEPASAASRPEPLERLPNEPMKEYKKRLAAHTRKAMLKDIRASRKSSQKKKTFLQEKKKRKKEARRERLEASRKRASRNQAKGSSRFGDTSEEEDGDEDEEDARAWAGPVQAERPPQFSTGSGGETVEAKGLGKARVGQFRGASIARLRAIEQYRAKRGTTDFSLPGAPVAESGSQVHTFA